jgi:hypothetical protein
VDRYAPTKAYFPWDCTEAYDRYPTICGNCNIPSTSLPSLSTRGLSIAPPLQRTLSLPATSLLLSQRPAHNHGRHILVSQLANAPPRTVASPRHCRRRAGVPQRHGVAGGAAGREAGRHRSMQPCSHHFEKDANHHYFVAGRTHLRRK